MKKQILLVVSILLLGFSIVSAQIPKTISGGVLNGKAQNLPAPEFPAAAKAVNASGTVNVQVTIDEDGNVTSANAISGHPLLRSAAVDAARQAKFTPTQLSGQAVKVTGVIIYNFTPATSADPAQPPMSVSEGNISGGIVNGKAKNLAIPAYPAAAKAVGAEGAVNVQVTIDENGDVVSASSVSGHPLLRQAAETAAFASKFKPTLLNGQAVKVTGIIVYNFTGGNSAMSKPNWFKTGFDLVSIQYNPSLINLNVSSISKVLQPDWTAENQQLQSLSEIKQAENAGQTKSSPALIDATQSLIASLQSRLGSDELKYWQFNTGLRLSEALAKFRNANEKQSALDSLRQQTQSAPSSVSPEYLADLQKITAILEKQKQTADDMQQIGLIMPKLFLNDGSPKRVILIP
ncbi:MAG: TonB family protein [Acidobacteriota bacterium]